jgi:hypothetical protein
MNINAKTYGDVQTVQGIFVASGSAFFVSGGIGTGGTDATKNGLVGGTAGKGFLSGTFLAAGDYRVSVDPRFLPVEGQFWDVECHIRGQETGAPSAKFLFVSQSNDAGQITACAPGFPLHFQHKQVITALTQSAPLSALDVSITFTVDKSTSY